MRLNKGRNIFLIDTIMENFDSSSALLLWLATMVGGTTPVLFQTNFWFGIVGCLVVAGLVVIREFVKK